MLRGKLHEECGLFPAFWLADGDERVAKPEAGVGAGVERGVAVAMLDGNDHPAEGLTNAGFGEAFSQHPALLADGLFEDLQGDAFFAGDEFDKIDDRGAGDELGNLAGTGGDGRDNPRGAGFLEFARAFGFVYAGDDVQVGAEAAGG